MNQQRVTVVGRTAVGRLRPTFLCIGQPHSGTTWLHGVLSTHPQIRLPLEKKDVDYFCFNHHRGDAWYLDQFGGPASGDIREIGEVGPMYLYGDLAAERIADFGSIRKLIVMLREPVSWFVSRYHAINKSSPYTADRELFLKHHGHEFDLLDVESHLVRYFAHFERDAFLFVTVDELSQDACAVKRRLAEFLEIDPDGFGTVLPGALYNQARQPRFRSIYKAARTIRDRHFRDFEWITAVETRFPLLLKALFREPYPPPHWLFEELLLRRARINRQIERLGHAVGRDLSGWMIRCVPERGV